MTVIAWDGKTLAADKRSCSAGMVSTVTKIARLRGHLVGGSGDFAMVREAFAWFEAGADPSTFTDKMRDKDDYSALLVIDPQGKIWKYDISPHPFQVEDAFHAIGSGRDFAISAMALGKTAAQAVEFTSRFVCDCGNGVDTLEMG